jgi:hypothetical protein
MMKKQVSKKRLQVSKESVRQLSQPQLQQLVGGSMSCDSCFPDICQEKESSGC